MFDNEFPPLGGGTGVVNLHLFEELSAYRDVRVDLVTSSRTRDRCEYDRFSDRIGIYKVPVDNRNIHHATNAELIRYAFRGLRKGLALSRQTSYDLTFAFAGVPAGAMSRALLTLAGLPYVVSLQGPDVPGFEARYDRLYPVLAPVIRSVWRHAEAVIAISDVHCQLAKAFMPAQAIRVIHNGVDMRLFSPAQEGPDTGTVRIICAGRLIERKGQHHLLEAFARVRMSSGVPVRLVLAGTGDRETQLRSQADQLRVTDAVEFLGYVPRESMPALYATADLFVLPSQSEGMSMALLEAMASGLPVIVTDTGGSRELVTEGENGHIVAWGDVDGLTAVLGNLVARSEDRKRMGAASRKTAGNFSWPVIARQYLDLCEEVLRSRSARKAHA